MHRIVTFFALSAMLLLVACQPESPQPPFEKPLVISTIKPIQALVLAIAGDTIQAQQLMPDTLSPHQYSVRPSDAHALQQAELIIRIDAQFEAQLDEALQHLRPHQQVITLSQATGLKRLPIRTLSANAESESTTTATTDLHLWLDPENGQAMAKTIQAALTARYPDHTVLFAHNTEQLLQAIRVADEYARHTLAPVKKRAYITFHDAWQYFDKRYDIELGGTMSNGMAHQISARHLKQLYDVIKAQSIHCLFYEAQFSQRSLESVAKELGLRTKRLDPMGSQLSLSADTYPALIRGLADSFAACLQT